MSSADGRTSSTSDIAERLQATEAALADQRHQNDALLKRIDDARWVQEMEDILK